MSRRHRQRERLEAGMASSLVAPPAQREGETSSEVVQQARDFVDEQRRQEFRRDLLELLALPAFRRWAGATLWAKCFGSTIWRPNADIQRFAARHDLGKEITAEFYAIDPLNYLLLEKEQLERQADDRELLRAAVERFSKSNSGTEGTTDGG